MAIARSFDKSQKLIILLQNRNITSSFKLSYKHLYRIREQIKTFHVHGNLKIVSAKI